jgi:hypothetical protein
MPHPDCQFGWGTAEASHIRIAALVQFEKFQEAQPLLREAYRLRTLLGHPAASETKKLLGVAISTSVSVTD